MISTPRQSPAPHRVAPRTFRTALAILASAALCAFAATGACAAPHAEPGALTFTVGTTSLALTNANVSLTCARRGSSGRRISAPSVTLFNVVASDKPSVEALLNFGTTPATHPTGVLEADATSFSFAGLVFDRVTFRNSDARSKVRPRLVNATGPLSLPGADLAASPAASVRPTLAIAGLGAFRLAESGSDPGVADLTSIRLEGTEAERLVSPCITGKRVGMLAVTSSAGRTTYASARIAQLSLSFDSTGLHSGVMFDSAVNVAPSPPAMP